MPGRTLAKGTGCVARPGGLAQPAGYDPDSLVVLRPVGGKAAQSGMIPSGSGASGSTPSVRAIASVVRSVWNSTQRGK